jgi:hypothetical protein
MDQGVHELRMLVLAGEPEAVRRRVSGLADWLSAPPVVYAHLPIGEEAARGAGLPGFLRLTPAHLRLLACKPSWDGAALVVRVQETAGQPASGELAVEGGPRAALDLGPYEIRTLRLERRGSWREAPMLSEL